ncbi:hypothetical protein TrRE_jg8501 [Triparma retinervis]|uniref:Uncharacterized protein n=1 Tax=Triparma retinervis TaxID=2557542 RepID=A0A9W7F8H3_9STRA|nr:hypothetical protein TrRE_jg8501 [Triparma retinervis]
MLALNRSSIVLYHHFANRGVARRGLFGGLKKTFKKALNIELTAKEKREDNIQAQIDKATAGAPPIVKLFATLATPLINKFAASAAKMQEDVEETLASARLLMLDNKELESILGQPLTTSMPMTTGMQSVNMNGKAVAKVEMQFQVMGNSGRVGMATMVTKNNKIERLSVMLEGRTIDIRTGEIHI